MGYFSGHYNILRLPVGDVRTAGFRLAQIAATHSVSAHFFNSDQPAIVTMPTGSGKTTVLMALAFVLRAQRVLILTPSRLVREQIAENSAVLLDSTKKETGIGVTLPILRRIRLFPRWETLSDSVSRAEALRLSLNALLWLALPGVPPARSQPQTTTYLRDSSETANRKSGVLVWKMSGYRLTKTSLVTHALRLPPRHRAPSAKFSGFFPFVWMVPSQYSQFWASASPP
jgi:hypothetical protein